MKISLHNSTQTIPVERLQPQSVYHVLLCNGIFHRVEVDIVPFGDFNEVFQIFFDRVSQRSNPVVGSGKKLAVILAKVQ